MQKVDFLGKQREYDGCGLLIIIYLLFHIQANIELKKGGGNIVTAPSMAKLEDMVGKNTAAMNYEFPDNDNDSDKVSRICIIPRAFFS